MVLSLSRGLLEHPHWAQIEMEHFQAEEASQPSKPPKALGTGCYVFGFGASGLSKDSGLRIWKLEFWVSE